MTDADRAEIGWNVGTRLDFPGLRYRGRQARYASPIGPDAPEQVRVFCGTTYTFAVGTSAEYIAQFERKVIAATRQARAMLKPTKHRAPTTRPATGKTRERIIERLAKHGIVDHGMGSGRRVVARSWGVA